MIGSGEGGEEVVWLRDRKEYWGEWEGGGRMGDVADFQGDCGYVGDVSLYLFCFLSVLGGKGCWDCEFLFGRGLCGLWKC